MTSVKQIIVKSTTQPVLLHCEDIENIHHLPIRRANCQSSSKCSTFNDILRFCVEFRMGDKYDVINEICNEKKYSSMLTTFSKISALVTVSVTGVPLYIIFCLMYLLLIYIVT